MTFTLPFRRADVFKEVTQFSNPLGADNVEVRFERDGKPAEEGAAVQVRCHERLRGVPNGWHPVAGSLQSHTRGSHRTVPSVPYRPYRAPPSAGGGATHGHLPGVAVRGAHRLRVHRLSAGRLHQVAAGARVTVT